MTRVTVRPRARLDLLEQFVHFGEEAGLTVASRYYAAVNTTCKILVKQPRSGSAYRSDIVSLKGIRRIPVRGFEKYLIFYLRTANGIELVRVIHGARNILQILAEDEA
jgi:toxin ParE1/3/4